MEDKLNFELLDKYAKKTQMNDGAGGVYFHYDWTFAPKDRDRDFSDYLSGNTIRGFFVWQTPPKPAFFQIYSEYYPNGNIKRRSKDMMGGGGIGEEKHYDENGTLTHVINNDEKFGKFGYNEVLLFLHQQGHINLETGENRSGLHFVYHADTKQWYAGTMSSTFWQTDYIIDGETGEVISKEEYEIIE